MPLRKLIDRASYPPEALAVIYEAFDRAWAEVGAQFEADGPQAVDLARNRLAKAVLAEALTDASSAERLTTAALAVFARMVPFKDRV